MAFAWGKMDTRIGNTENRVTKMESAIICTDMGIRDIIFKLGTLEGKVDIVIRK